MGQVFQPSPPPSIILSAVDRLVATNADGGLSPLASHVVLLGEDAGENLGDVDYVYVIGAASFMGGFANPGGEGTSIYGAKNLTGLIDSIPPANDGPMIVIGYNNLARARERVGSCVVIGSGIGANIPNGNTNSTYAGDFDRSVLIGQDVLGQQRIRRIDSGAQAQSVVVVGYSAARGSATVDGGGCQFSSSVVIGAEAALNIGKDGVSNGSLFNSSVVIGSQAYQVGSSAGDGATQQVVCIGASAANQEFNGRRNTYLGAGVLSGSLDQTDHVVIGAAARHNVANGAIGNILIGSRSSMPSLLHRNIFIGHGANSAGGIAPPNSSDNLLIETTDQGSGLRRCLVFGNIGTELAGVVTACGIEFGLSTSGVDRDLPGMNIVKIVNGSASGAAPTGGGFLYSATGQLHWVDTNGADRILTTAVAGFTVATLPAGIVGQRTFVTDALAPAFGVALVGGGGVVIPAFFNGGAWIAC